MYGGVNRLAKDVTPERKLEALSIGMLSAYEGLNVVGTKEERTVRMLLHGPEGTAI